jgi:sulfide:quinone oxidoreductase
MRALILGAGFGGLTVATELRRALGDDMHLTLVDRRASFVMGLRKLWVMIGRGTFDEGRRSLARLGERGVEFVRDRVTRIDPAARRVWTESGAFEGDYLVVALGAEPRPELVPGLPEFAFNLYEPDVTPRLAKAVADLSGGKVVIVIAGVPYKCPPAPYEAAMLLDDHLRERGLRDRTTITVTTVQPMLLPNAGAAGSAWLGGQLDERNIGYGVGRKVERVEQGRVVYADGQLEWDLLIGVPAHRPPTVVRESGLTAGGDWVKVNPGTLETPFPRVWAIGDVTQTVLANGLPLPKAGLFAEAQGRRVAAAIVADARQGSPPAAFDGRGHCFIEMGRAGAALVEGDFFARPEPVISLREPSAANLEAKRAFERERLRAWFGM